MVDKKKIIELWNELENIYENKFGFFLRKFRGENEEVPYIWAVLNEGKKLDLLKVRAIKFFPSKKKVVKAIEKFFEDGRSLVEQMDKSYFFISPFLKVNFKETSIKPFVRIEIFEKGIFLSNRSFEITNPEDNLPLELIVGNSDANFAIIIPVSDFIIHYDDDLESDNKHLVVGTIYRFRSDYF